MFLFAGGFYAYVSYAQQVIANKIGTSNSWFAWVPLLNVYLMVKMAGKPVWWLLLFLLPLVNIIIFVIIWMKIASAVNKPQWIGVLMLLAPINLLVLGYLAFWDGNPSGSASAVAPVTTQTEALPSEAVMATPTQPSAVIGIPGDDSPNSNPNSNIPQ